MILFLTVLFIEEDWLSLLKLLKISFIKTCCAEKLLHIGKNTFLSKDFVGESGKELDKFSPFIY